MQETLSISKEKCFHCGDDISGIKINFHQHTFCCDGCKTVYSILESNDLCDYYSLNDIAGFSLKNKQNESYQFLDEIDIINKLSKQISPNLSLTILSLPQIHCSSCVWLLEKLYKFNENIYSTKVDFLRREIEIRYNHEKFSLRQVVELINQLGYKPDLNIEVENSTSYDNALKLKIGVAGFVFGNVMLFSFPEYLGLDDEYFQTWFSYINLILGIPILFFSGRDYLTQAWQSIKYKTYNINIPLALGMIVMYVVSIGQVIYQSGPGYIDSLSGLIFFLLIGKWYQQRSYHYLSFERDYKSYFPISCTMIQDGEVKEKSIDKIEVGDELLIKNNQIIPVDGILISDSANVDYSFVTGEEASVVVLKSEQIYAGGKLKDSNINIRATAKVKNSYLVSLWNNAAFIKDKKDDTVITDKLSKYFTLGLLIIATISFIYWLPTSIDNAIKSFTSVLIVACPCAIALTVPFLYGNIMRLLSKQGIFLRQASVIDTTANIQHIVFDKTGTITTQLDKELSYHGKYLNEEEKLIVHALAFQSSHPLSIAIEKNLRSGKILEIKNFKEYEGLGVEGICNGSFIQIGSPKYLHIENEISNETRAYISIDKKVLGYFSFSNQYRNGISKVITGLNNQNKNISILSGDNDKEKCRLQDIFGMNVEMNFNQDPHLKLDYIKNLQQHNPVAMIGDGLNDAGALKQSNLGIVVTESNNNFTPSCDIILRSDQFHKLASYFQLSNDTRYLIAGAYLIAILYNIVGLSYAVQANLSPIVAAILMPISSLTIVVYTIVVSGWLVRKRMR